MKNSSLRILALAASLVAVAAPASAEEYEFTYSPEDLTTSATRDALLQRIDSFAASACRPESPLLGASYRAECAADLRAQLVSKIGDDGLMQMAGIAKPAIIASR